MPAERTCGSQQVGVHFDDGCGNVGAYGACHIAAYFGGEASCAVEIYGIYRGCVVRQLGHELFGKALAHLLFREHYGIDPEGEHLFFNFVVVEKAPVDFGASAVGYKYHILIYIFLR